ncbi:MAG: NAD(+)/NADH kinase [Bacteroidales bacterium]|nr:NAD(+)/NADH kinase [Bacteroidales bacterium]
MMNLVIYIKNRALKADERTAALKARLAEAGFTYYDIPAGETLREGTDMVLSLGGDGTFLSAARLVGASGVPVAGVNFGRLGFLSENTPEDMVKALVEGTYRIKERTLLEVNGQYALNEVAVHRHGGAMLGVEVKIDGRPLPVYWADGLLVATSAGSTAYSLSAGGPICMPGAQVLLITPIAPHNLNVRPLVVPDTSEIEISVRSRDPKVTFSLDNRITDVDAGIVLKVTKAPFRLRRVCLDGHTFIQALTSKLFWGEDVRNND